MTKFDFPHELLARYTSPRPIGAGGMGVVYRAHDSILKNDVAIKTLPTGDEYKEHLVRFQKEARMIARLDHPNVVRLNDFGVTKDIIPYMVMEFVTGRNLKERILEQGAIDPFDAVEIFIGALDGLAHAHEHGIIHRDLKTSNIMLDESLSGQIVPKIIDFGIAKFGVVTADSGFESTGGKLYGSPAYMSPEVARGLESDTRLDVYSMGCVIFESLAGQTPFEADSPLEMVQRHANETPQPLSSRVELPEDMQEPLDLIVAKCLEKEPEKRYQSAGELRKELVELYEVHIAPALDRPRIVPLVGETSSSSYEQQLAARLVPFLKERASTRWLTTVAVVCMVSLIATGVYYYFSFKSVREQSEQTKELNVRGLGSGESVEILSRGLLDGAMKAPNKNVTDKELASGTIPIEGTKLLLAQSSVSDRGLLHIPKERVHSIDLSYTRVTEEGLKTLASFPHLSSIELCGLNVTAVGLGRFRQKKLFRLGLDHTQLNDEGMKAIGTIKSISNLSMAGCKNVTRLGFEQLKNLPKLQKLAVSGTEAPADILGELSGLMNLGIRACSFDDADLENLLKLKRLEVLNLASNRSITGAGLLRLAQLKKLHRLDISGCPQLSADTVDTLKSRLPDCDIIYWESDSERVSR